MADSDEHEKLDRSLRKEWLTEAFRQHRCADHQNCEFLQNVVATLLIVAAELAVHRKISQEQFIGAALECWDEAEGQTPQAVARRMFN